MPIIKLGYFSLIILYISIKIYRSKNELFTKIMQITSFKHFLDAITQIKKCIHKLLCTV